MGIAKRQVDVALTDDQGVDHLRVMGAHSEWATDVGTASNDVASTSKAAESGKAHVIRGVYASFDTADTVGLLTVSDGTTRIEHHIQGSQAVSCGLRAATNATVAASLAAGGSGVVGHVQILGLTIDE